jgi:23S rRNA pseudouridine1911/1915/1917 synthase
MIIRLAVTPEDEGQRLDLFLVGKTADVSRSRLQRWLEEGKVTVDGFAGPVKASLPLKAGWVVTLDQPEAIPSTIVPAPIALHLVHEDDDLLVINKPPGIAVHPGAGKPRPTIVHGLLHLDPDRAWPGPPERPGIVHRLDRDTSGLMVVARSERAWLDLQRQIARHDAVRGYIALVWGTPQKPEGWIDAPIGRDPRSRIRMAVVPKGGRPARTHFRVLREFDRLSLLDLRLETGRTHQIRVHLAHAGFPVFGDPVYGGKSDAVRLAPADRPLWTERLRRLNRQALHAYHLHFRHPRDGRTWAFEAPPPDDLDVLLNDLAGGA